MTGSQNRLLSLKPSIITTESKVSFLDGRRVWTWYSGKWTICIQKSLIVPSQKKRVKKTPNI